MTKQKQPVGTTRNEEVPKIKQPVGRPRKKKVKKIKQKRGRKPRILSQHKDELEKRQAEIEKYKKRRNRSEAKLKKMINNQKMFVFRRRV